MQTEQKTPVKPGDYFYTSWGYDQTNIDYIVVEKVSSSGKTTTCRMVKPIHVGEESVHDVLTPGTAYGEPFTMRINEGRDGPTLRGSYPFCQGSKRLDTFLPAKLGEVHYQTMPQFGH